MIMISSKKSIQNQLEEVIREKKETFSESQNFGDTNSDQIGKNKKTNTGKH